MLPRTRDLRELDPRKWTVSLLDVILAATLVLIVSFGPQEEVFKIASQVTIFAFLIKPALVRNPLVWLALAVIATASLISTWVTSDNHKYLFVYWIWVVFLAVAVRDEPLAARILRAQARFFLVFVFLAAGLQKLLSPTYMSGEMFELKLLNDSRFLAFAQILGMDASIATNAKVAYFQLMSPLTEYVDNAITLPTTDWVHTLALSITWYDLVIQIVIGLLFAIRQRLTDILGHLCLLFFIFTTYIPAPVFGFGWTLAIYGYATTKGIFPRFAATYVGAFIAILLYQFPWRDWVAYW